MRGAICPWESLTTLPKRIWRDPRVGRRADTESAHPLAEEEGGEFRDRLTETNHGGFDCGGVVGANLRRMEAWVKLRAVPITIRAVLDWCSRS